MNPVWSLGIFAVSKNKMKTKRMDTKILGNKIARARKENNMSQAQLAQHLFISQQAVGKWERGESIPDIITINQLAEIFDVDLNYFSEKFISIEDSYEEDTNAAATDDEQAAVADLAQPQERELLTNFSANNLAGTDFAGIIAHKRNFEVSTLSGSDFSGADLTGSTFKISNTREANFNGTNLTDCNFSILDLGGSSFKGSILVRTEFNKTEMAGTKFIDTTLTDAKLTMIDLRETIFERCTFNGVDFKYCDLRGMRLDGLNFTGVKFDKAALNEIMFKDAILRNVSFRPPFALTNKYYKAMKTIRFNNVKMDKLTYAALKGMDVDLSGAAII